MIVQDFYSIVHWWLVFFFLGIVGLPVTLILFKDFFDRGYIFSKIIGVLFLSWAIWILGSLKVVSFTQDHTWLLVAGLVCVSIFVFWKQMSAVCLSIKTSWRVLIFEELLFFAALTFWSLIRGYQPDIRGLEKFMDFGFVNAIARSPYFPPTDMWFAGGHINYYYFGHLVTVVLIFLSGIPSGIGYNLMLGSLFALTFTGAFCLGANLCYLSLPKNTKYLPFLMGILTSFLLTASSNLHPLYWLIKHGSFEKYWYPDATRFIVREFGANDNTIHEFPIYSFVVADLHGHLLNLPFVLLFLGIAITVSYHGIGWVKAAFVSFLLGIFYITNTWDLPIYALVLGGVLFFYFLQGQALLKAVLKTSLCLLPILLGSFIFSLPFSLTFKNISKGIFLTDFHSPLWMLAVLWGLPFIVCALFAVYLVKHLKTNKLSSLNIFAVVGILVAWVLIVIPEVIYVRDIYIHEYQRANTVFKFTYQSFVIFSIITPFCLYQFFSIRGSKKMLLGQVFCAIPVSVLLLITISYSYFAINSYYGVFKRQAAYKGLGGERWLRGVYPGEYNAVLWLDSLPNQPTVLQAVGDSYTDFDVVSSYTGLPTVQGWLVHEWLWRGSFDEPGRRASDVEKIYTTDNPEQARSLLAKYKVSYVIVGSFERQKYLAVQEDKFKLLGSLAYSSFGTNIYKIN